MRLPGLPLIVALVAALLPATPARGADDVALVLVQTATASVAEDAGGRSWLIGNAAIRLRLGLTQTGLLVVQALEQPAAGQAWSVGQSPDLSFTVQSRRLSPGQDGFPFRQAEADEYRGGVRLRLTFDDLAARLRVTRHYVCYASGPVLETWTTFEALGGAGVTLGDIGIWQLSLPVSAAHWVTGLQATAADGGRFARRERPLSPQAPLLLGSTRRSSEQVVPTAWFDAPSGHVLGAVLWSGAWSLVAAGPEPSGLTAIRFSLGDTVTAVLPGSPLDSPHGIFGLTGADDADVTLALQRFTAEGLRTGRPLQPLVTYNTWFAYGIQMTDAMLRAEMAQAASLGAELFVLDAGWYAGGTAASDFDRGLGNWTPDPARFPQGLRPLRDAAHAMGLKFGLWIEPERVDTATLNRAGLARERFLATAAGRYNAGVRNESAGTAQVCLADAEARQWVLAQLVRVIDEVQPDYLKWDNNYWINCDRPGHGHGTHDGNFAHTRALYGLLAELRARYPELLIENCAEGGNRLDLGLLQYTDAAWMDDTSAPSAHVRHNLEGLGAVFPPAYLLSFLMDHPAEPIHGAADMALYFRSRMGGVLGLSIRGAEFGDEDAEAMRREVALAKAIRDVSANAGALLLTGQVPLTGGDAWDAMQWYDPESGAAVLFVFAGADSTLTVRPRGLLTQTSYVVALPKGRALGRTTGQRLMDDGITFRRLPFTAGYVLALIPELPEPQPPSP